MGIEINVNSRFFFNVKIQVKLVKINKRDQQMKLVFLDVSKFSYV